MRWRRLRRASLAGGCELTGGAVAAMVQGSTVRDRLIMRAIERELSESSDWQEGFFDELREVEPETANAVNNTLNVIRTRRRAWRPMCVR